MSNTPSAVWFIEDDALFYPRFVERLIAASRIPVSGIVVARAPLKHNRLLHAIKTLIRFRPMEIVRLAWLVLRRTWLEKASVAAVARAHNIPCITAHGSANTEEVIAFVAGCAPQFIFSANPLILGKRLLAIPECSINMHFSLLPAYKGIMPLFHAMADGQEKSGISLHEMTSKIDEGRVLAQLPLPLDYQSTLIENYQRFFDAAVDLVSTTLLQLQQKTLTPPAPSGMAPSYVRQPDKNAWKKFRSRSIRFI